MLCILAGTVAAFGNGCTLPGPPRDHWARTYDPKRCGSGREDITRRFNLHRGRWWNYYSRGRWYLEFGHAEAAAGDFRRAIGQRRGDKRGARSYGMHFWDYFPHRELGIALFRSGEFAKSVKELRGSLAGEESARASFYLNRARASLLKETGADKAAPVIRMRAPAGRILSNRRVVSIRGTVSDDQYVGSVSVAGENLFIEVARRRIDIEEELRLRPGQNVVAVKATDLVGRSSSERIIVTVDVRPPTVCVQGIAKPKAPGPAVAVDLAALDDHGLQEIRLGDQKIACAGLKQKTLRGLEARPGPGGLRIVAIDLAGNVTTALIDVSAVAPEPVAAAPHRRPFPRLGFLGRRWPPSHVPDVTDPGASILRAGLGWLGPAGVLQAAGAPAKEGDVTAPRIDLGLPKGAERLRAADEDFFLDGRIYDPGGISSVFVNDEKVRITEGKNEYVAFNHFVRLKPGLNVITVAAADHAKNQARSTVRVELQEPQVLSFAARYTLGLTPPLKELGPDKGVGGAAYAAIVQALFDDPRRFNLVERSEQILQKLLVEHKLTGLADKRKAIRLGRIVAAEGMLFGQIEQGKVGREKTYWNIYVQFVDTESSKILCATDVYGESRDRKALDWYVRGLVSKIKASFPLVHGEILKVEEGMIYLNIGRDHALRHGMKLLLYRQEKIGNRLFPKAIKLHDRQVEARVVDLFKDASVAELSDPRAAAAVKAGDKVITK